MAPVLTPDADFYTINGSDFTVRANGSDDYDNLQTVLNAMDGVENATLRLYGHLQTSYQLVAKNIGGDRGTRIFSEGQAVLQGGTDSAPMRFLDATDRKKYNPNGWPDLICFHQDAVGGTPTNVIIEKMTFQAPTAEGYEGVSYGGFPTRNISLEAGITFWPGNPSNTVFDVPLTMTGVVPQPLGDVNVLDVFVYELAEGRGDIYIEGTDYSVDYALGTITRIPAGAITSGQAVFASYNNVANQTQVYRSDVRFSNCTFRGFSRKDANGNLHQSMLDSTIWFRGSRAWILVPDDNLRFAQASPRDARLAPIYSELVWDRTFVTAITPMNGSLVIEDCLFEDASILSLTHLIGAIPGGSPYVAAPNHADFTRIQIRNNRFVRCGIEQGSGGINLHQIAELESCIVDVQNNEYIDCGSALGYFVNGAGVQFLSPHPAQDGGRASFVGNKVRSQRRVKTAFGEFGAPVVGAFSFGVDESIIVANNELEHSAELPPTGNVLMFVNGINRAAIVGNKFKSVKPTNSGVFVGGAVGTMIYGNDFSELNKIGGSADIVIASDATDIVVHANPDDTIQDEGTDSVILGGITFAP